MKLHELLAELTFHGSKCTKDCSGHKAGWDYVKNKNIGPGVPVHGDSKSFDNGAEIAQQRPTMKNPRVRDDRGRFTYFPKSRSKTPAPQKPMGPKPPTTPQVPS